MKRSLSLISLLTVAALNSSLLTTPAFAADLREITVTIERAECAQDTDDNINPFGKEENPDLFATVSIADRPARTSQTVENSHNPALNFVAAEQNVSAPTGYFPITIKLFDRDTFGGNKQLQIGPGSSKEITLYYRASGSYIVKSGDARVSYNGSNLVKLAGGPCSGRGCGIPGAVYVRVSHR
jgi:hypothetical protein